MCEEMAIDDVEEYVAPGEPAAICSGCDAVREGVKQCFRFRRGIDQTPSDVYVQPE